MITLSILLPTRDRNALVIANLSNLLRSDIIKSHCEIIIGDNNSSIPIEKSIHDEFISLDELRTAGNTSLVRVVRHQENLGVHMNIWKLMDYASGLYSLILGDDDFIVIKNIERLILHLGQKLYRNNDFSIFLYSIYGKTSSLPPKYLIQPNGIGQNDNNFYTYTLNEWLTHLINNSIYKDYCAFSFISCFVFPTAAFRFYGKVVYSCPTAISAIPHAIVIAIIAYTEGIPIKVTSYPLVRCAVSLIGGISADYPNGAHITKETMSNSSHSYSRNTDIYLNWNICASILLSMRKNPRLGLRESLFYKYYSEYMFRVSMMLAQMHHRIGHMSSLYSVRVFTTLSKYLFAYERNKYNCNPANLQFGTISNETWESAFAGFSYLTGRFH